MRFDAGGGRDPDDGDKRDGAERDVGMIKRQRNRDDVEEQGGPVLALDGGVLLLESAGAAEAAGDGHAEAHEGDGVGDHADGVESNREGVHLLIEKVGGEEGQEREREEEDEVGVEDERVGTSTSNISVPFSPGCPTPTLP